MRNSTAFGWHVAIRAAALQMSVTLVIALAATAFGWRAGAAACFGGLLAVLGTALLAARAFGHQPVSAMRALFGLAAGLLLKWMVALGGLWLALVQWKLAPIPVIAGFGAALFVNLFALRFKDR